MDIIVDFYRSSIGKLDENTPYRKMASVRDLGSYEEFPLHSFSCRFADGQEDQHSAQKDQDNKRIKGPGGKFAELEGDADQELHQRHKSAQGEQCTANNVELSLGNIPQKNHNGSDDEAHTAYNRKRKRQEPIPAGGKIDVKQINRNNGKPDRNKDYGIGFVKPEGQHKAGIAYQ